MAAMTHSDYMATVAAGDVAESPQHRSLAPVPRLGLGMFRPSSMPDVCHMGGMGCGAGFGFGMAARADSYPSGLDTMAEATDSDPPLSPRQNPTNSTNSTWTWRLVWCHERCHKQENEGLRRILGDAARSAGASLVCLKKASKFAVWLRSAQRPPYVLLTDWRELKPCINTAKQVHISNQPTFTIVFCKDARHYERACAWAKSLPPRADPVHVCKDLTFLKAFLADISKRAVAGTMRHPAAEESGNYSFSMSSSQAPPWTPAPMGTPRAMQPLQPNSPIRNSDFDSPDSYQRSGSGIDVGFQANNIPLLATTPLAMKALSQQEGPPADMQQWAVGLNGAYDNAQVEQLLLAAQPEVYDD